MLLALDIDGTLAPIAPRPEDARVAPRALTALRFLSTARAHVSLAFLTGRDAASAWRLVAMDDAWYAVEHGRALYAPGELAAAVEHERFQAERDGRLTQWVEALAPAIAGTQALIEEKSFSRALHVRQVMATDRDRAEVLLNEAERTARGLGLEVMHGKAVCEVAARLGDKGAALERLMALTQQSEVTYVGDDTTDIPAIEYALQVGGQGYFVVSDERPRPPRSNMPVLRGVDGVVTWLEALAQSLGR